MRPDEMITSLTGHHVRKQLVEHPFFDYVMEQRLSRDDLGRCISQWWHPLQYFPTFLSRTISNVPWLHARASLSKILYQELGEGDASRSHEGLFLTTMLGVGFTEEEVTAASPYPQTEALVQGMAMSSRDGCLGLGYVYGIEVVDLPLVSWVGKAITGTTGKTDLPWVDIHLTQEGDHVDNVRIATDRPFSEDEAAAIATGAKEMWRLWHGFFDGLLARVDSPAVPA